MTLTVTTTTPAIFQFPLAERTSCNQKRSRDPKRRAGLSVSSSGTNELQHQVRVAQVSTAQVFQFPLAERTSCNVAVRGYAVWFSDLSVSSSGTNELQQWWTDDLNRMQTPFSFL